MKKMIAIDPGSSMSAYVLMDADAYRPLQFGKLENDALLHSLRDELAGEDVIVVLERVASFGMPVGRDVFRTCEWIGRFAQVALDRGCSVHYILRSEEKMQLCHDSRAKDANIRRALIDRFAQHDMRFGKGTRRRPDVFFGFSADVWSAFAVGVTWLDKRADSEDGVHDGGRRGAGGARGVAGAAD